MKGIVKNEETAAKHVARRALCANINISPLTMSQTAHSGKFSIPDHKRLLETFGNVWKRLVVSRLSGQLRYANASFRTKLVFYVTHCAGYSLPLLR